jgi:glycosyltransferase involved in cell wall biosynthesis
MPPCSIIIPVYNRAHLVGQTIESCLAQDYPEIEVILIDDGSTDKSGEVCQSYAQRDWGTKRLVQYFHQVHSGACVARNVGMSVGQGEYLLFLDSDDLIPPDKLSRQIAAMRSRDADCCICDYQTIDERGNVLNTYVNNLSPRDFVTRLRSPCLSAVILRRSSIPPDLKWNVALKRVQDVDFMLRYFAGVNSWTYLPETLFTYRLHAGERISDTYTSGIPYLELYRCMRRYCQGRGRKQAISRGLQLRYGCALVMHCTKSYLIRRTPRWAKDCAKAVVLRSASTSNK